MIESGSPDASKSRLGSELSKLAVSRGVGAQAIADAADCSVRTANRILGGDVGVKHERLVKILDLLKVDNPLRSDLESLAQDSLRRRKQTPGGSPIPDKWARFFRLEGMADRICVYGTFLMPGVLQTPDYMSSLFLHSNTDPDEIKKGMRTRLDRQEHLFRRFGPEMHFIISEAAIRVMQGGPTVMAGQLNYLIKLIDKGLPIQVLPFNGGYVPGSNAPFTLLRIPGAQYQRWMYSESMHYKVLTDDEDTVAKFERDFTAGLSKAALPADDTVALLATVVEGLQRE